MAQKEVHPTYSTSCKVEAPGSSPVTNKCEPNLRRAKSWDLTFTTATDQSSQSLAEALGEDLKAADSCYDTASSRLVYCNLKAEETVTPNLREDSFASFKSQDDSVDSNNNFELRYLKQEGGDGTHLRRNKKSQELRDELSDKKTSKDNSLSVKVFREVAIQTIPINSGARVKKPNKPKKDTLPKLNLPSESSLILEEKVKETDSLPPQSPHSPLLTIPKLSIPDSPHSHDSDSLSSSFSFKTANSSPPQSPGATSNNSSREADVSSEGLSSYTSSSSPPDLFFSCTEGDLSRKLSEKMEKQVDENFNKGLSQSDSGSSPPFKSASKPKRSSFDRERSYSATTVDEDGALIDLINADLADEPLTEADKEINAKLLKESQLASERFWNRKGRRHGTMASPTKATEKTADDSPSGSRDAHKEMSITSPNKTNQEGRISENSPKSTQEEQRKKSSEDTEDDPAEDIKAEILKSVGPIQKETNLSKSPQELEKMRQENKTLHRKATFINKMPELAEASETESAREAEESAPEADKQSPPPPVRKRSSILSDALLRNLGLLKGNDVDPLKMSEKEIELKFTDLSMAMKSSKDTLEKRAELQKRERDLAEENISKELDVLLSAVQTLECYEADSSLYRQASQLQQQVGMLQTMMLNLSRVAEGLGQVQQEKRISTACEVMVKYVDNLRLSLERKQAELEEARKVIQDNRLFLRPGAGTADDLKQHNRRASSVNPYMKDTRGRFSSLVSNRASVVSYPSRQMERTNTLQPIEQKPDTGAEKTRRVTSVTFTPGVTSNQKEVSPLARPNDSSPPSTGNRKTSLKTLTERRPSVDRKDSIASGDESFRLGFEQGVQNQVSQELEELREQQRIMVENLEELMDSMDEDDKEEISRSTRSYPQLSQLFVHPSAIPWVKVQKIARLAATFFLVLAACFSVVFTLMPVSSLGAGAIVFESPWSTVKQFFWPYTSLSHTDSPPR